jgi:hypothetical protein
MVAQVVVIYKNKQPNMATSKYESREVVSNCTKIWLRLSKKIREIFYHLEFFFKSIHQVKQVAWI